MGDSSDSIKSSRPRRVIGGLVVAAALLAGTVVSSKYFHADQAKAVAHR